MLPEEKRYSIAFDFIKAEKEKHMSNIRKWNPALVGCPRDDFTDSLDLVLLDLSKRLNR